MFQALQGVYIGVIKSAGEPETGGAQGYA